MRVIIVGNGVAGTTAARLIAERDQGVEVVLCSDEPYLYYPRPRLIDLVGCQVSPEQMPQFPPEWYAQRGITLRLNCRVEAVYPEARRVLFQNGEEMTYDRLMLATGARAWVPPISGADLPGVYTLRTLADGLALCQAAHQAKHAVVLGGGLLGLDASSALLAHGLEITVVEVMPRLLPRQLDAEGAAVLQARLEARGLRFVIGEGCVAIEGDGRVRQIVLQSGRVLPAEMVVISAGVRANTALAQAAGLACGRGVVVDDRMQTSAPDIYAAGDVAEFRGVMWGIIPAALAQARVAAAQIVGESEVRYEEIVPSTTLKVSGIDLTSIGEVNPERPGFEEVRFSQDGVYKKAVLREGRIVGAIILGDRAEVRAINQLIAKGVDVSPYAEDLFRPGFDLMALAQGSAVLRPRV